MYRIAREITHIKTKKVLDYQILKRVENREHAIYALGFLIGKRVYENGGDPTETIVSAEIDEVIITDGEQNFRYTLEEE